MGPGEGVTIGVVKDNARDLVPIIANSESTKSQSVHFTTRNPFNPSQSFSINFDDKGISINNDSVSD